MDVDVGIAFFRLRSWGCNQLLPSNLILTSPFGISFHAQTREISDQPSIIDGDPRDSSIEDLRLPPSSLYRAAWIHDRGALI